jgi:TPR repeat protein
MKNILYTIILSFLFSSAASAEIYKWVDDEGKVHYGEKLPDNTKGKSIETIKTKDSVSADFQAGINAYLAGDYETALKIYRSAAEQGDIMAQFTLARIYMEPKKFEKHGATRDYKESAKWYHLAAEQGDDIAQFMLGLMYKKGQGVTKNLVIAYMWLSTAEFSNKNSVLAFQKMGAVENKNISEKDLMNYLKIMRKQKKETAGKLESEMTSEQIAKAKELARQCVESDYKDCG